MSRLGTLKQLFKSIRAEIKAYLRQEQWKEALIFFCFVLLSLGLWMMQSLQQEYEINVRIPIKYKNITPDIAFMQTPPAELSVKVKDKGSVLLNYSLAHSFAPLEADIKTEQQTGRLTVSRQEIENSIRKQLITTTSLIGFEPKNIDIAYGKQAKKVLPVVFNGTVQTTFGVKIAGEISFRPASIQVFANAALLDTMKEVKTVFTEIKKGNKTIARNVQLQTVPGTTFEPKSVSITIPIEAYTEKNMEVPILCTDIPPHYAIRLFPSIAKINCSVPLSRFKEISPDDFKIQIRFADLEQNATGVIPLQLDRKPAGVDVVRIIPNKIEFILEKINN